MGAHHAADDDDTAAHGAQEPTSWYPAEPGAGLGEAGEKRAAERGAVRARVFTVVANLARWVGLALAVVCVLQVVLVVGEANPDNAITSFVADAAEVVALEFTDLFVPDDPKLATLVNYGIAALFWLLVSSIVVRIVGGVAALTGSTQR